MLLNVCVLNGCFPSLALYTRMHRMCVCCQTWQLRIPTLIQWRSPLPPSPSSLLSPSLPSSPPLFPPRYHLTGGTDWAVTVLLGNLGGSLSTVVMSTSRWPSVDPKTHMITGKTYEENGVGESEREVEERGNPSCVLVNDSVAVVYGFILR